MQAGRASSCCNQTYRRPAAAVARRRGERVAGVACRVHKEYARQDSSPGSSQLLSTPEDVVFECLTQLRCG
jgi:hypothetical protein